MSRLLTAVDFTSLSTRELRDAVPCASFLGKKGAQADHEAIMARGKMPTSESWGPPWIPEYHRHCVVPQPDAASFLGLWHSKLCTKCFWQESTNDPRFWYFCGTYEEKRRELLGMEWPDPDLAMQAKILRGFYDDMVRRFGIAEITFEQLYVIGYRWFSTRLIQRYLNDTQYKDL